MNPGASERTGGPESAPAGSRAAGYVTAPRLDLVDDRHRPLRLRPSVRRALGALLTGSPRDEAALIDAVWPDRPPRNPRAALATVLSRLRAVLPADALVRTPDGYLLSGLPGPRRIPLPFTGRDREIAELRTLLRRHSGVLVTGAPGIGKSRLLTEFAADRPGEVATVPRGGLDAAGAQRLTERVRTATEPFLIVVDDIDELDARTLSFLDALADVAPVRWLGAARETVDHGSLPGDDWTRLPLGRMPDAALHRLVTALGGDPAIAPAAGGDIELFEALLRGRGAGSVAEVVLRRLSGAPTTTHEALQALCVAGRLDWATAEAALSDGAVEELEAADLIVADGDGLRPASRAVAESVIVEVPLARRRRLLRRLTELTPDPVQRAKWSLQLGRTAAPDDHARAAASLLATGDPDGAEAHAAAAFDGAPGADHAALWLHTMLLGSLSAREIGARTGRLADRLGAAAAEVEPPLNPFLAATAFLKDGDPAAAERLLDAAPDHQLTDEVRGLIDAYRGRPDPARALAAARRADPKTAAAAWTTWYLAADLTADPALDEVLDELDPDPESGAADDAPDSPDLSTHDLSTQDLDTHGLAVAHLAAMRSRRYRQRGEPARARRQLDRAAAATGLSDLRQRAWLHTLRSELAFAEEGAAAAVPGAVRAAELLHRSGHRSDERVARQWLALVLACAGRFPQAREALAAAASLPSAAVTGEHFAQLARALADGGTGRTAVAAAIAEADAVAAGYRIDTTAVARLVTAELDPPLDGLTPREREVVRLVADRRTAAEIAGELGISVRTVQNHTAAAYRKLGISSRRDLPADL